MDRPCFIGKNPCNLIPFNKPSIEGNEIENILSAIKSGKLAGNGYFTGLCQKHIEKTTGAGKSLLTSSGTDALEMCALLCNIGPGDEVVMPSFTFVSTANAFCLRGAKPVFCDIGSDDMNIDPALIENLITPKTKAIVVVHYAGAACDMDRIRAIARKHDLYLIEDAAHAYLSTYRGKHLGTLGDFGVFSFHETKNLICGEGGALLVNRREDVNKAEIIWEKGTNRAQFFRGEVDKYTWTGLGSSFLPSELTAAFLYGQLVVQEKILAKRKAVFDYYQQNLAPLAEKGLIQTPKIPENSSINYHMYYILVADHDARRQLLDYLKHEGIAAVFHYVPLHSSPYAKQLGLDAVLPVTESIADRIIRLPFFNAISPGQLDFIIEKIFRFFKIGANRN